MSSRQVKKISQLVFVAVMLVASFIMLYKNFISSSGPDNVLLTGAGGDNQKVVNFEEALKVLEDNKFKNLIKFGTWPVQVETKGRANPFVKL
jgi:hypothetical protein